MRKFKVFVSYTNEKDEWLVIEAENEDGAKAEALAWVCPWDTPKDIEVVEELIRHKWVKV